ncbi:transglutaminase-like cysteine peptidase [Afifella sp. IM 167]|uniref:transglutaminase-like cysteine peptidase n=1 Tax=Afifella sp. IM 167 TaxID=2033586 RepID=UPI001CCED7B8|nr:transglutaminase-like cysteine peptidase [Afifella sp. IM 167]MBZ8134630.1 transglutaminase [Afifella sp. IM 167]
MQWDKIGAAAIGICMIALAPAAAQGSQRAVTVSLGHGSERSEPMMRTGSWASQPVGHRDFCRNFPAECQARGSLQPARLTQGLWDQLTSVNDEVNRQVQPVTDKEYYGTEEVWTLPDSYGDCEDYVLLKRKRLVDLGWSTADTLVAVVFDEVGAGHAVLVVRTDRGDFVLDNKVDAIRLWSDTGYRYVKRQDVSNPMRWVAIDDTRWQMNGPTAGIR